MQVYVPNSTSTTFPLRPAGVSGSEWSHDVAPAREGASRSIGKDLVPGPARRDPFPSLAAVLANAPSALASPAASKTRAALMLITVDTMGRRRRTRRRARRPRHGRQRPVGIPSPPHPHARVTARRAGQLLLGVASSDPPRGGGECDTLVSCTLRHGAVTHAPSPPAAARTPRLVSSRPEPDSEVIMSAGSSSH